MRKPKCHHCGKPLKKPSGAVNRARKMGMRLFCDQRCFGLSRRIYKPKSQKVAEKRLYDIEYRRKNRALLKAKKAAYFQRTYDPIKAARERKARMHLHVEYCRRPAYRRWKKRYDQRYRARRFFGPYADSFLTLQKLEREIARRATRYEIYSANGTLNKSLRRRREYESLIRG